MGPKLPLVVGGAPGVDPSLPHRGHEGGVFPKLQGIRGLDVVVPVDQDRGGLGIQEALRVEDGVQRGFVKLRAETPLPKPFRKPEGRLANIFLVGRVGGYGGDGQELQKGL